MGRGGAGQAGQRKSSNGCLLELQRNRYMRVVAATLYVPMWQQLRTRGTLWPLTLCFGCNRTSGLLGQRTGHGSQQLPQHGPHTHR